MGENRREEKKNMLTVIGKYASHSFTWNVGEDVEAFKEKVQDYDIRYLWADGKELEYIRERFDNLPIIKDREGTGNWAGEMARFIYINL